MRWPISIRQACDLRARLLSPVNGGSSRSLRDCPPCMSRVVEACTAQIHQLTVRVRFPPPAPRNCRSDPVSRMSPAGEASEGLRPSLDAMRIRFPHSQLIRCRMRGSHRRRASRCRTWATAVMSPRDQTKAFVLNKVLVVLHVLGRQRQVTREAACSNPGIVDRTRPTAAARIGGILPQARETASSECNTTTRSSQSSSPSRVRRPHPRAEAHCQSSPTVTNVIHHATPVSFAANGPSS